MGVSQDAARNKWWSWSRFFYLLTAALLVSLGAFSMVSWNVFRRVGWPPLVVGFILAFIAMIPVFCLFSDPPTCYSVIGFEYRDLYGLAPVRPQLLAGTMAAVFAWASAFLLVWFRARPNHRESSVR